jgi:RsiW-degrading membrane proteinase PrsW (M82 family)
MSLQSLLTIVGAVVVVGVLAYRQLRWRRFDEGRALRLPIILGGVGAFMLADSGITRISAVDVTFLLVELALSVGIGLAMGRLTSYRREAAAPHAVEVRTGAWGASLWLVLIGARVGLDLLATSLGGHLLTQTGMILILLGASRLTSAVVTRNRMPQAAVVH